MGLDCEQDKVRTLIKIALESKVAISLGINKCYFVESGNSQKSICTITFDCKDSVIQEIFEN